MIEVIRYIRQYIQPITQLENNRELLQYVSKILNENEIEYIIIDGTLLGFHREKDIIYGDDDVDFMVRREHYEKAIQSLKDNLPDHCNTLDSTTFKNFRNGKNFWLGKADLNPYDIKDNKIIYNVDGEKIYDYEDFYPLKKEKFLETEVLVPNKTEKVLEYLYGDDYMIPRAHYKGPNYDGKQWQPPEFVQYNMTIVKILVVILLVSLIIYTSYRIKKN